MAVLKDRMWPWRLAVKGQMRQACLWSVLLSGELFPCLNSDYKVQSDLPSDVL